MRYRDIISQHYFDFSQNVSEIRCAIEQVAASHLNGHQEELGKTIQPSNILSMTCHRLYHYLHHPYVVIIIIVLIKIIITNLTISKVGACVLNCLQLERCLAVVKTIG